MVTGILLLHVPAGITETFLLEKAFKVESTRKPNTATKSCPFVPHPPLINDPEEIWMTGNSVMKMKKLWAVKEEWGSSSHVKTCGEQGWKYNLPCRVGAWREWDPEQGFSWELCWAGEGRSRAGLLSVVPEQSLLKQGGLTPPRGEAAEATNGQWGWLQHHQNCHQTEGNVWLGRLLRLCPLSHKPNLPCTGTNPLWGHSLHCSPISACCPNPSYWKNVWFSVRICLTATGFCLMKVSKLSASFPAGLQTHTAMVQGVINYLEYSAI